MVDRSRVLALLTMSARRKPRLLVLNQYYWPGVEATAQLLTELCEALAEDMEIKVVTGVTPRTRRGASTRQRCSNGVEIVRVAVDVLRALEDPRARRRTTRVT